MRLYLAVAVLVLAFVAYTEAQEAPEEVNVAEKLNNLGAEVTEFTKNVGEKVKTAYQNFQTSDFAVNSKSWFQTQFEKAKSKFGELTN